MIFAPIGTIFLTLGILFWKSNIGQKPGDPEIFLYTFGGMGALFLLLGLGFLFIDLRRRHRLRNAYYGGYLQMSSTFLHHSVSRIYTVR